MEKRTLNFAILKYFTNVEEASVIEIEEALRTNYGSYKAFKKNSIVEALMTAESNALIEEVDGRFVNNEFVIYYRATPEQKDTINSYIK